MATLWVGPSAPFTTLKAAVAAASSGDTIYVLAGTYHDDYSIIEKELTIEGVGGLARFRGSDLIPNRKGIFIVVEDAELRNLGFFDARVTNLNGAGIRHEGGHLLLDKTLFESNENGILAAGIPGSTLTILNSEFAENGYGTGYTHGVYANAIDRLTIRDSYFHDTKIGHHVKSRAFETVIAHSRLIDGEEFASSYAIDLPNAGVGVISKNHIVQSAAAPNGSMINFGSASGRPGSSLTVEDNTLVNSRGSSTGVQNWSDIGAEIRDNDVFNVHYLARSPNNSNTPQISGTTELESPPPIDRSAPWRSTETPPRFAVPTVIGEWDLVGFDSGAEQTVELKGDYLDPLVIFGLLSGASPTFAAPRLKELGPDGFTVGLDAPLDQTIATEGVSVPYLVVERGSYVLPDGTRLEASWIETDLLTSAGFVDVTFASPFEVPPIILSDLQSWNDPDFAIAHHITDSADGFRLAMQEAEASNGGTHLTERIGWVAIQPGSGSQPLFDFEAGTLENVDHDPSALAFGPAISGPLTLFADLASYNGADPAMVGRHEGLGPGFEVFVHEDTTKDAETWHRPEQVAYLALEGERGFLTAGQASLVGAVSQVEALDHNVQSITFGSDAPLADPVVFATLTSRNGSDPTLVEIGQITAQGVDLRLIEPDYLGDGGHTKESVAVLALSEGSWGLADGSVLAVGRVEVSRQSPFEKVRIDFPADFAETPVVLAQVQSVSGAQFVIPRVESVDADGFTLRLQVEEALQADADLIASVGWMAVDPAAADHVIDWDGLAAKAINAPSQYDHNSQPLDVQEPWAAEALILAGTTTFEGPDPVVTRLQQDADGNFLVRLDEEASQDNETWHAPEALAALAFAEEGALYAAADLSA